MKRKIIIAVSVVSAVAIAVTLWAVFANKHELYNTSVNALPESVSYLPYFKEGSIYYYRNGVKITVAENCYDTDDPIYSADYAIDSESGKMLYAIDKALYLFDGEKSIKIAENVAKWKTQKGMESIIFSVLESGGANETLGGLFLYENGSTTLIDVEISASSIYMDDMSIYALKPNSYPQTRSRLVKYSLSGESEIIDESMPNILYAGKGTVVCTETTSGGDSNYYFVNGKARVVIKDVYKSELSEDGSFMYVLGNYDGVKGKLYRISLAKNEKQFLKDDVSDFSCSAVANSESGIIYSLLTDETNMYYAVYYTDFDKTDIRLLRNTDSTAISFIAINGKDKTGYVFAKGSTLETNTVYYIKIKGENLESKVLAKGAVGSMTYYGLPDAVTFAQTNGSDKCTLSLSRGGETQVLTENCSVYYYDNSYKAQCVLSNDGNDLLYFADKTDDTSCGTLCTLSGGVIAEDVLSGYYTAPVTDAGFNEIYYLQAVSEEQYDLYCRKNGKSELIDTNVQAIVAVR